MKKSKFELKTVKNDHFPTLSGTPLTPEKNLTPQTWPERSLRFPFWGQGVKLAPKMPFTGLKIAKRSIFAVFPINPILFPYIIAENHKSRSLAPILPLLMRFFGFLRPLGIPGDN